MENLNEIHEVEIVYRNPAISKSMKINSSQTCAELFRKVIPEEKIDFKEFFYVALLNNSNVVLGVSLISVGSTNMAHVNIKEIFQLAIKTNATGIILCHNHPSGKLSASKNDIDLTQKIRQACSFCDITLLDHIILTREGYFSFADEL